MSTEVYAGRECSVTLISPIDGSTLLTVPYVRTLSVQDKIVYARRTAHKSSAISAPVIRANGSVTLTKDAESMAVVNEIKRWANGVYSYSLASNLKGKRYRHPHLRMTMTNSDGTVETITAYDVKLSDRSLSRPDGTLSDSITLDALGGIDTPNNDHGDPYKALTLFRTGSATYINTAGTLTTAGDGVSRFGVPTGTYSSSKAGLVLEGTSTNLLANSSFGTGSLSPWAADASGYTTQGTATVTNGTGLIGGNAIRLVNSASNTRANQIISVTSGTWYTVSAWIYINSLTSGFAAIRPVGANPVTINQYQYANSSIIQKWQCVSTTFQANASGNVVLYLYTGTDNTPVTNDIYFADLQFEALPFQTSYIDNPVASGTASRSPDLCALTVPHNLLQQSQNLSASPWSLQSGAAFTANNATAPDGTQTAGTWNGSGLILQDSGYPANAKAYAPSIWVKTASGTQTFKVVCDTTTASSISQTFTATTTWQRVSLSGIVNATDGSTVRYYLSNASGALILWAPQLEQASIPGIYVPTTSQALPKPTDGTEWPSAVQGGWTDFTQNGRVTIKLTAPNASGNFDIFGDSGGSIRVYQVGSQTKVSRTYSGGTTVLTLPASIADGNLHTLVIWWTNQGGSQVLNATVDGGTTTTVAGSGAWTAGERLWGSNGSAFCALQSFVWDIAPLPNGATPAA